MTTSKFEVNYSSNTESNSKSGFETVVLANCILNAPLMLLSIVGNALVLVAILRTPSVRSPSVIFLCNLAVTDLLVGLVVQPTYIAEQLVRTVPALEEPVRAMGFSMGGVSLSTMTAITVDRFLALHYHIQYPNLMTKSRAIYTIITIWCIITLFSFSILWSLRIYYVLAAFCITICLLVCLVCFIKIYRIVRRHQLQIQVQQQAVENSIDTHEQQIRQSNRSAKNIFIYFLAMILCYSPFSIVVIISGFTGVDLKKNWLSHSLWYSWTRLSIHFCIVGVWPSSEWQFLKQWSFFLVEKRMKEFYPRTKSKEIFREVLCKI